MQYRIISLSLVLLVSSCTNIQQIGSIGPRKLEVYSVAQNDFLSSSRMLVVLDKRGDVKAYTGGTVSGFGSVGLETGASLATAGAIAYAANTIKNTHVNVRGVPSSIKHTVGLSQETNDAISHLGDVLKP